MNTELHTEFDRLIASVIEGEASDTEIERLIQLGEQSTELKQRLRTQLAMDSLLSQSFEHVQNTEDFVDKVIEKTHVSMEQKAFEQRVLSSVLSTENKDNGTDELSRRRLSWPKLPWIISGLSMAACLLLSISYMTKLHSPSSNELAQNTGEIQHNGVAVIANAVGLSNDSPYQTGNAVIPGELKISKGFLELEFYQGAQLKIAGPAHLDVIDEQRVRLISGKVMTDVPQVAIGFTIDTPNSEVVDLGTAIGVHVDENGDSQVHVFDGLVEARSSKGGSKLIEKGSAVSFASKDTTQWTSATAETNQFEEFSDIDSLTQSAVNNKHIKWNETKVQTLKDPSLIAYYDFEQDIEKTRKLRNIADSSRTTSSHDYDGAIVGAQWAKGPWPGKSALEFKHPADRVRIDIKEQFTDFTLAAWVKIDSLDRQFNSLLLTDGFDNGDIHWQLGNFNNKFGTVVLGTSSSENKGRNYNFSPFFSAADSGTWYHLATTMDQTNNKVSIFVNGIQVRELELVNPSDYWYIGEASLGNWNSLSIKSPLRNLNGSMAEFVIFSRALSEKEIASLALTTN